MTELYFEFFTTFSKMECALKEAGYLMKKDGEATANWDTFANSVDPAILQHQDPDLQSAYRLLKESPPWKQVAKKGRVLFEDTPFASPTETFRYYTDVLRRLRNNLFHGGKFNKSLGNNPSRNRQLVSAGLRVLEIAAVANPRVRKIYLEIEW